MATGLMNILRHQVLRKTVYSVLKSCNKEYQVRFLSNQKVHYVEELKERGLIQVSGNDASQFLQGLITNDMKHLDEGSRSMYTMFLNTKGRVMYDAILYKNLQKPAIFIECDKAALNDLQKHLKMFKIRRKVELNLMNNYKVWVIFSPDYAEEITKENELRVNDTSQEKVVPCQAVDFQSTIEFDNNIFDSLMDENLIVSWDPRLPMLGIRLVAEDSVDVEQLAKEKGISIEKPDMSYKSFRYKLGIGEGITELPYGNCFPLEMNCDYLHGVSFHKGCYIGQELTARTHHTGVVRKRLMPIILDTSVEDRSDYKIDTQIEVSGETGRAIGKLRGVEKNTAIGLVRISEALSATKLKIGGLTGYTVKPKWWPHEAPKGSLLLRKE